MGEERSAKQMKNRKIKEIYMEKRFFSQLDKNGIIRALPGELSEVNRQRLKKFGDFVLLYRPRKIGHF